MIRGTRLLNGVLLGLLGGGLALGLWHASARYVLPEASPTAAAPADPERREANAFAQRVLDVIDVP
jgi:hypothetical protein